MSVNLTTGVIPFTELFERLMTLAKIDSFNNEDFAKGLINDSYTRALPGLNDWNPIIKESSLTMSAYVYAGTVSVTAGSTAVTGSGTAWTASQTIANGWRIKFAGNDNIYEFTYTSPTTATINPALSTDQSITGGSYTLFRDEYPLPADFDRFLKDGSMYAMTGGRLYRRIGEFSRSQFREQFYPSVLDPVQRSMISGTNALGLRTLRVNPPPRTAKVYPIEYVPKIAPMREYTTGTVSVTTASAVVTGSGTAWLANVLPGMYFRIDSVGQGDSSKWYQILTVDSDTQVTLTAAYGEVIEAGVDYTICSAPTVFPPEFHDLILYDAVSVAVASADDPNTQLIIAKRGDVLNRLNKTYKSRRSNQQFGVDDDGYR